MSLAKDREVLEGAMHTLEDHKDVGWDDAAMAYRALARMVTLMLHWEAINRINTKAGDREAPVETRDLGGVHHG